MERFFHSVRLDKEKCKGCINCMKRCPTEAIRVREGRAIILSERCIDCGECIRICQYRAKSAVCDDFSLLDNFQWKIAMPAPSFYGQFDNLDDINLILTGLKHIGFDDVFEVSRAAEIVTQLTRDNIERIRQEVGGPVISSACTAVVRLIRVRFPALCDNVLPIKEPLHLAAEMARSQAVAATGLKPEQIGVFFISPCPAKVTSAKAPIGIASSHIDGVLSAGDTYFRLLPVLPKITNPEPLMQSGVVGINWGASGGESAGLLSGSRLSADGIENIIHVLEEIESEKLQDVDFVELNACPGGCVGGVLNVANPFVAKARIEALRRYLPITRNSPTSVQDMSIFRDEKLEYEAVFKLDDDMRVAMEKMMQINELAERLPGLDCGSCGAPSCRTLAEDVVSGWAKESDCIIRFRDQITALAGVGEELSSIMPAPFRPHHRDTESNKEKE